MAIEIRQATESDMVFVVSSWVDSYRSSYQAGLVPMHMWDRVARESIGWILNRPGCQTIVASLAGSKKGVTDVSAWLSYERDFLVPVRQKRRGRHLKAMALSRDPLIHYAFTKQVYRKHGLQRALMRDAKIDPTEHFLFTCKTGVVSELQFPSAKWSPLIARFKKDNPDGNSE